MLPLIERETVDKYKWINKNELLDIFSMSQCTPGVIAVNAATFIGNRIKGVPGAMVATLGVITPSIVVITFIATLISNISDLPIVEHAFAGIRVAVAALILSTCIKLFKATIKMPEQIGIAIAAFVMVTFFGASSVIVVIVTGIFGFFFINLDKLKKANLNKSKGRAEAEKEEIYNE